MPKWEVSGTTTVEPKDLPEGVTAKKVDVLPFRLSTYGANLRVERSAVKHDGAFLSTGNVHLAPAQVRDVIEALQATLPAPAREDKPRERQWVDRDGDVFKIAPGSPSAAFVMAARDGVALSLEQLAEVVEHATAILAWKKANVT